jgi:hypothetical protein
MRRFLTILGALLTGAVGLSFFVPNAAHAIILEN